MTDYSTSKWEVSNCPLCTKRFHLPYRPKHNCRACNRIICGSCSWNSIVLPGGSSRQRVCDTCYEIKQNEKLGLLHEETGITSKEEVSLKSELKTMFDQSEYYRSFLTMLVMSTSQEGEVRGEEIAMPDNKELSELIGQARRGWNAAHASLGVQEKETARLSKALATVEKETAEMTQACEERVQIVAHMEEDLKDRAAEERKTQLLSFRTQKMEEELDGLRQRKQTLEQTQEELEDEESEESFHSRISAFESTRSGSGPIVADRCQDRECSLM